MNPLFCYIIVSYDIWFYLSHVALHHPYLYRNVHKTHHALHHTKIQYKDTYVSHALEGPMQSAGVLFPLFFISFHFSEVVLALFLINLRGVMRHDPRFVWLIGNHHLLHHQYPQYNYGEYWLDVMFGTEYPHKNEYRYGLIYV